MEWAEDRRETGATAIAIAICSFSPPPSSFQQLNLFLQSTTRLLSSKTKPHPSTDIYLLPKKLLAPQWRLPREQHYHCCCHHYYRCCIQIPIFFPIHRVGCQQQFQLLIALKFTTPKKKFTQSIAACFQDFASFDDLFARIVLQLSKRICLWRNATSASVLSNCLYCGLLLMFGIKWLSRG